MRIFLPNMQLRIHRLSRIYARNEYAPSTKFHPINLPDASLTAHVRLHPSCVMQNFRTRYRTVIFIVPEKRIDGRQQLNQLILIIPFYSIPLDAISSSASLDGWMASNYRWRWDIPTLFSSPFGLARSDWMDSDCAHRFSSLDKVPTLWSRYVPPPNRIPSCRYGP